MGILKNGSRGEEVRKWQYFLRGEGYDIVADGIFGSGTEAATKHFQSKHGLASDGIVGRNTLKFAHTKRFDASDDTYPQKPDFKPLTASERVKLFGAFDFVPAPTATNPEKVKVISNWKAKNLVKVVIPVLAKMGYSSVRFHRKGAAQLEKAFELIDKAGLNDRILSYGGSYNARFIRGSRSRLSNHSWATAIDINMAWNGLGRTPAAKGQKGSVYELVEIFAKCGFYWGGHFNRKDGMHFELARIMSKEELSKL